MLFNLETEEQYINIINNNNNDKKKCEKCFMMIEIVPKRDFQGRTCTFYIYPPLVWAMIIILR